MNLATLQDSVFLHSLGSAILNSLWQGFIIWLIYETINISYKNLSSVFKNRFSTLLLFISFIWFLVTFVSGFYKETNTIAVVSDNVNNDLIQGVQALTLNGFISLADNSIAYLSVAYILLLAMLMLKLFSSYRYVYMIAKKRLLPPPSNLEIFTDKVVREFNIAKKISVWISKNIDVPATVGFLKPVILIPVGSINSLTPQQLEAIILHEVSHIKRNDYLVNLFISVIETILFFNPFILLLAKAIKRERENCCDDFVIQYRYDPQSYASALLRLEQSRRGNLQLAMGAVSGKKQLLSRIKRITNDQKNVKQFNYGQKLFALLIVTFIICSIAWLSPGEKKKDFLTTVAIKKSVDGSTGEHAVDNKESGSLVSPASVLQSVIETSIEKWSKDDRLADSKMPKIGGVNQLMPEATGVTPDNNELLFKLKSPENSFAFNFNSDHPEKFFTEDILKNGVLKMLSDYAPEKLNIQFNINSLNESLREANKNINIIDLKKIEGEVEKSLVLLKAERFSQADVMNHIPQNFENLSGTKNFKKQKPNFNLFNQLKNNFIFLDSVKSLHEEAASTSLRIFRTLKNISIDNSPENNDANSSYYNYFYEPPPLPPPTAGINESSKNEPETISVAPVNRNGVIIERTKKRSDKPKTSFHFSISNDSKTQSGENKIVSIEVIGNE